MRCTANRRTGRGGGALPVFLPRPKKEALKQIRQDVQVDWAFLRELSVTGQMERSVRDK